MERDIKGESALPLSVRPRAERTGMRLRFSQLPLWSAFLIVLLILVAADRLFAGLFFVPLAAFIQANFDVDLRDPSLFDLDALSGIWMALISLALGTLLLVISIASQSIPRLVDLYLHNRLSLIFIWFLILGTVHSLVVMQCATAPIGHSMKSFNLLILLPIGVMALFPYTCHVLKQSKPDHIIQQIYAQIQQGFGRLEQLGARPDQTQDHESQELQGRILESFNQLDDVMSYISFKGPRAAIISLLGKALRQFIQIKPRIPQSFFLMAPSARNDISFMTIADPQTTVEKSRTLMEQKILRLMRNAYYQTIAASEYDLASLCMKELLETCRAVIAFNRAARTATGSNHSDAQGDAEIEFLLVWFNTFMRVAIKDAERMSDIRNLFNLLFYYGQLGSCLVDAQQTSMLRLAFRYLRIYGEELYNKSRRERFLEFAVDVVAAEMGKVLRQLHQNQWPAEIQLEFLKVLLSVDRQHGLRDADEDPQAAISLGVRLIQMGLALFYLDRGFSEAVQMILDDLKQDLSALGVERFRKVFDLIVVRLRVTGREFWEDTDRGNESLYYAPQKHRLEELKQQIIEQFGMDA